jgi:hypothetical protein
MMALLAARVLSREKEGAGGAKTPPLGNAERNRMSRSRAFLASVVTAALAAAMVLFLVRASPDTFVPPRPDTLSDAKSEKAVRELAVAHCAAKEWRACLLELDEAKRFDPAGDADPKVTEARGLALAAGAGRAQPSESTAQADAARRIVEHACKQQRWSDCIDALDLLAAHDHQAESAPLIALARRQAEEALADGGAAPPRDMPAKPLPPAPRKPPAP